MLHGILFIASILVASLLFLLKKGKARVYTVFKLQDLLSDLDMLFFVNTYTHRKKVREMRQARKETVLEENEYSYNRDSKGRFATKEEQPINTHIKYVQKREDGTYEILQNIKG